MLYLSEKVLSLEEGLASSAFRCDTSQRVAYGNQSQPSVYLYEGDKLCAKKEGLSGSGIFPSPMRLRKRFQKIRSCTAIRLTNKIFKI